MKPTKTLKHFAKKICGIAEQIVDKLSIEEAGVIANNVVTFALSEKLLSVPEAETIKAEMENYLKKELVKIRTPDELYGQEGTKKFKNDLSGIIAQIAKQF